MKKSTNILNFSFLLYFLIAVFVLYGCNVEKRIARKDSAAVERVNAKATLQNIVGVEWSKLHPCLNDTITTNSTDTLYLVDEYNDTDTLFLNDTLYITNTKTVEKKYYIHDTVTNNITDNRQLVIERGFTERERIRANEAVKVGNDRQVELNAANDQISKQKSTITWFWVAVGLGVIIIALLAYLLFKKK